MQNWRNIKRRGSLNNAIIGIFLMYIMNANGLGSENQDISGGKIYVSELSREKVIFN